MPSPDHVIIPDRELRRRTSVFAGTRVRLQALVANRESGPARDEFLDGLAGVTGEAAAIAPERAPALVRGESG